MDENLLVVADVTEFLPSHSLSYLLIDIHGLVQGERLYDLRSNCWMHHLSSLPSLIIYLRELHRTGQCCIDTVVSKERIVINARQDIAIQSGFVTLNIVAIDDLSLNYLCGKLLSIALSSLNSLTS